ncbi:hypothetical protein H4R21_006531, partial [Coemansia helicoidea]
MTVFFDALSQQRYYSTRFSSRKLVRVQFPAMHRELYEYFLGHCERHHYHTWGCQLPPGHSAAAGDVCSSSTLHSGCYRLYEGALSDAVYPDDAGDAAIAGPLSDPRGYAWQP